MNKFFRFIQYYLIIGLPFVIGYITLETFRAAPKTNVPTSSIATVIGMNLMLWFVVLILFLMSLLAFPNVREQTLSRLANLKERDEREQYITGRAARATYISTLSLIILLLFFSLFSVNLSNTTNTLTGKPMKKLNVGLHFTLLNKGETKSVVANTADKTIFDTNQISLSTSAIILILLGWQLFIFNYYARKEQLRGLV